MSDAQIAIAARDVAVAAATDAADAQAVAVQAAADALAASPGPATTGAAGLVELATNTETTTGTDNSRAVTPAALAATIAAEVPAATTTTPGRVELATSAETIAGTDTSRAITPAAAAAAYIPIAGAGVAGIHRNTDSPTYGGWYSFGNAMNSMGFAGTGSPAEAYAPLVAYQKWGDYAGGSNAPVLKTTQTVAFLGAYYGPTADDSAETGSSVVLLKNTGTPYTQTEQTVAWESSAQVEANVSATGIVSANGGRVEVVGSAQEVASFKASANTQATSVGSMAKYVAFWQPASLGYGTAAAKYGVYVVDQINTEDALTVGASGWTGQASIKRLGNSDGATSLMVLKGPDSAPGLTNLSLIQGTGQTKALFEARDSSGNTRFAIGATGVPRVSGVIMNFTDGSNVVRMVMDHATGLELKEARNIIVGTTTGTKIGTATSQKLAFFNATPIVQPSGTPADATDLATAITLVNWIKNTSLRPLGLAA